MNKRTTASCAAHVLAATAAALILAAIPQRASAAPELAAPSVSAAGAKQATVSTTLSEDAAVTLFWGPSADALWRSADLGTCAAGEVSHTEYTLLSGRSYCFQFVASNETGVARSTIATGATTARAPACPRYSGGWYDGSAAAFAAIDIPCQATLLMVY